MSDPTPHGDGIAILGTTVLLTSDSPEAIAYVKDAARIREDLVLALKHARDALPVGVARHECIAALRAAGVL